ncbi:hypothetical protein ACIRQQ_22315 [Streptomyces fuscichromogenes]|uniref:hypothetical protein n=1 Tax=Streptomyces fuscichromogenes TaxID=1324013 RepID=UPI00381AA185
MSGTFRARPEQVTQAMAALEHVAGILLQAGAAVTDGLKAKEAWVGDPDDDEFARHLLDQQQDFSKSWEAGTSYGADAIKAFPAGLEETARYLRAIPSGVIDVIHAAGAAQESAGTSEGHGPVTGGKG